MRTRKSSLTDEEKRFIRDNYKAMTMAAMANHIGRQHSSVRQYIVKLGLQPKRDRDIYVIWSNEDFEKALREIKTKPAKQVAAEMGITPRSLYCKFERRGYKVREVKIQSDILNEKDMQYIRSFYRLRSAGVIADRLKKPIWRVRQYINQIKKQKP